MPASTPISSSSTSAEQHESRRDLSERRRGRRRSRAGLTARATLLALVGLLTSAGGNAEAGSDPKPEETPRARLAREIDEIRARPAFRSSTFGLVITHVRSGSVLAHHNAGKLLTPASTVKLITAAGALATLGPDHRFETRVVGTGSIDGETLAGDLVLVASGDPNLSQRPRGRLSLAYEHNDHSYAGFSRGKVVSGDPLAVVRDLARQVRKSGVREIAGDVVVDDGLFEDSFDSFVGPVSAVCVNDNLVDVFVEPARRVGEPPRVEWQPRSRVIDIRNGAKTAADGAPTSLRLERRPGLASWELRGEIAADASKTLRVAAFAQPGLTVAHLLAELLSAEGVRIGGEARRARLGPTIYADYRALAEHVSPPLSEAVKVMLKVSQNVHATMLPLVIGAELGKRGSAEEGFARIHDTFAGEAVDMHGLIVTSGSGGGRADRISPLWMAGFLRHLRSRPYFDALYQGLPVGGVDGTLASKFQRVKLRERVRAKTGTLVYRGQLGRGWVYLTKSLAGYIDLRTRKRPDDLWAFSIAITNTLVANRDRGAQQLFRAQEDILEAAVTAIEDLRR